MAIQETAVLQALEELTADGTPRASALEVAGKANVSESTARRHLTRLVAAGKVVVEGRARSTRYSLAYAHAPEVMHAPPGGVRQEAAPYSNIAWSPAASRLLKKLAAPLMARDPVAYNRTLLDNYVPGVTWLLPRMLADDLLQEGRLPDQQPAGTYARKVLEQLLVDLSWSSSRLEGNTYSLLDTERLFKQNATGTDIDAVMLLNHKRAIEFLVDDGPMRGLTTSTMRNIHALLMENLIPDEQLGDIRSTPVFITGTTFIPLQSPQVIDELFAAIAYKARLIVQPVEAAYFLWTHIAYLQPFIDGNKRTSRISANIPLTLYNCSPLAFMDVDRGDYARAVMGIYEFNDFSAATDLFEWTYRRSIKRYKAILQAASGVDQTALRFRSELISAIGMIVGVGKPLEAALQALHLEPSDADTFRALLNERLDSMQPYNSARYRLSEERTLQWIEAGRPR